METRLNIKEHLSKRTPRERRCSGKYVYDYSRFISPGRNLYCQLNLFYNTKETSQSEIECVIAGFKQPRIQYMSISHSDATSPVEMGTFTGSVRAMAESPDFADSFKSYFKLKHIGLWWAYPKSELAWTRDTKKWTMHYEIDRSDLDSGKNDIILSYFSKHSSLVDNNFFGTAMSIVPIFKPQLDDKIKLRIMKHAKKQHTMGSNLKSITLGGLQLLNWADSKMENTLHRQLMCVESIHEKKVVNASNNDDKNKKGETFKGRLFYAIITNQRTKMNTFYFSQANSDEARSVARGLPLFIRDYFKLKASYFCNSDEMTKCLEGEWKFAERSFLTLEEKDEQAKFSHLLDTVTAVREVYISSAHKKAMAVEGDDDLESVDTRLTKGNVAPPALTSFTNDDDISNITGNTRESKAKAYALEESKKVATQYISSIDAMKIEHDKALLALTAKLQAAELKLNTSVDKDTSEMNESTSKEGILVPNAQKTIDISSEDESATMSGLSVAPSSDDEMEPIMNTIRQKRRDRRKRRSTHSDASTTGSTSPSKKLTRSNTVTPGKNRRLRKISNTKPPAASSGSGSSL